MKKIKKIFLPISLLIALPIVAGYWKIITGFFQQDEFLVFGRLITVKESGLRNLLSFAFTPEGPHYVPFTRLFTYFSFRMFGINYTPYAILSLILNFLVIVLVYFLSKILFKDMRLAFLTTGVFSMLESHYQATSWVVVNISTHLATAFALLSLIFLLEFLRLEKKRFFIFSLLSLWFSVLFKEISFGMFFMLPLALYLFRNKPLKNRYYLIIIISGVVYLLFRGILLHVLTVGDIYSLTGLNQTEMNLIKKIISLPVNSVAQTFIPADEILKISGYIELKFAFQEGKPGDPRYDIFALEKVVPVVSILIFLLILFGLLFFWKRQKDLMMQKIGIFGFLWILTNTPILVFSPEKRGGISFVDSRNLYLPAIGVAFLVTFLFASFYFKNKYKKFVFIVLIIFLNFFWLNRNLDIFVQRSKERKEILEEIIKKYPNLPKQVIFYTESDAPFYGLPSEEKIMPFQSGFGQTLLIVYYPIAHFPIDYYRGRFLWEITDQGFRRVGDYAFGYFRDFNLLAETLKNEDLGVDSVIAFAYESQTGALTDKTLEVRGRLNGYFSEKKKIDPPAFNIESFQNSRDLLLATDGKRKSFWDSGIPYNIPTSITIKLKDEKKVVGILIDSYNIIIKTKTESVIKY